MPAQKTLSRILDIFRVTPPELTLKEVATGVNVKQKMTLSQYSETELTNLTVGKQGVGKFNTNEVLGDMLQHIQGIADNRTNITNRLQDMKFLSPEIQQIKMIYVSSILSPNDMQTDAINITVDTENSMLDTALSEFFNEYFNNELQLGVLLNKWLNRSLFESGASPVVVIPRSDIRSLAELTKVHGSTEFLSEDLSKSTNDLKIDFTSGLASEVAVDISFEELSLSDTEHTKLCSNLAEGSLEFIKENKDNLCFVSSPFFLKGDPKQKEKVKENLKEIESQLFGKGQNAVFCLSDSLESSKEGDHPFILELDPNLTVPICVPGSHTEHIGYFALADNNGNLMTSETYEHVFKSAKGLGSSNFRAMYGTDRPTYKNLDAFGVDQKDAAAQAVFGLTIKKLLKEQLNGLNLGQGITISQYDVLSKCLFYNMLKKIKTKIIFIPDPLMIYYAYEYRTDGSGKSLLEDVEFLLALRTTLIVATVLTSMKNAVDHKTIEVDVDEKNINLEQTLTTYKNIAVSKNIPAFNNNPYSAAKGIIDQSISVIPKNIKGLPGSLSVDKTHSSAGVTEPEPALLERLTEMFVTHIGVPPAALNLLGENEFARSIATTNLHFSNIIRTRQRQTKMFNTKLVKNYISYSEVLKSKILEIVKDTNVDPENDEKTTKKSKKPKKSEKVTDASIDVGLSNEPDKNILTKIISSIDVNLPTCNVSTDKARYSELGELIGLLDTVLDNLYPDTLVPKDDNKLKDMLASLKSYMKSENLKEIITDLGFHKTFSLPRLTDIKEADLTSIVRYLNNLSTGMEDRLKVLNKSSEEGGNSGGW